MAEFKVRFECCSQTNIYMLECDMIVAVVMLKHCICHQQIEKVRCPLLFIVGEEDLCCPSTENADEVRKTSDTLRIGFSDSLNCRGITF